MTTHTDTTATPDRAELRKFGLIFGSLIIGAFGLLIPWIWDLEIAVTKWPWPLGGLFILWGLLRTRRMVWSVGGAALGASVLFFVFTNLAVWAVGGLYPLTAAGLAEAFAAAIPFFAPTLAGDVFYTAVLFGGFALAERSLPALRAAAPMPAAG